MSDLTCFAPADAPARLIHVVAAADWGRWLEAQGAARRQWLDASGFEGKAGSAALLPADGGDIAAVLATGEPGQPWDGAVLHAALPGDLHRAVRAAVVDDEQLDDVHAGERAGKVGDRARQCRFLVEAGDLNDQLDGRGRHRARG